MDFPCHAPLIGDVGGQPQRAAFLEEPGDYKIRFITLEYGAYLESHLGLLNSSKPGDIRIRIVYPTTCLMDLLIFFDC